MKPASRFCVLLLLLGPFHPHHPSWGLFQFHPQSLQICQGGSGIWGEEEQELELEIKIKEYFPGDRRARGGYFCVSLSLWEMRFDTLLFRATSLQRGIGLHRRGSRGKRKRETRNFCPRKRIFGKRVFALFVRNAAKFYKRCTVLYTECYRTEKRKGHSNRGPKGKMTKKTRTYSVAPPPRGALHCRKSLSQ